MRLRRLDSFCPRPGISSSPRHCYWVIRLAILLFSCRSPIKVFVYPEERAGDARRLPGTEIIKAFSRHEDRMVYEQNNLIDERRGKRSSHY